MDYYTILGVPKEADEEQIKQAYRRMAKKYHPDLNPDDPQAEAKFKEIVEAYETLGDAQKRRAYDAKQDKAAGKSRTTGKSGARDSAFTPQMDFGAFTKDMEKYFGFSFTGGAVPQGQGLSKDGSRADSEKKNPLDVTEMFEAFMKMK